MNDSDQLPKTFVSLGNAKQPFDRILSYVHEQYDKLPKPILIQNGSTPFNKSGYLIKDFLSPAEYISAINSAEILIFHAGAGSIMHAVKAKKKPIIVPRICEIGEHINNHQVNFAIGMHDLGCAYLAQNLEDFISAIFLVRAECIPALAKFENNMHSLISQAFDEISVKLNINN